MYYSNYPEPFLATLADRIVAAPPGTPVWCVFDNTAVGFAVGNARSLLSRCAEPAL